MVRPLESSPDTHHTLTATDVPRLEKHSHLSTCTAVNLCCALLATKRIELTNTHLHTEEEAHLHLSLSLSCSFKVYITFLIVVVITSSQSYKRTNMKIAIASILVTSAAGTCICYVCLSQHRMIVPAVFLYTCTSNSLTNYA